MIYLYHLYTIPRAEIGSGDGVYSLKISINACCCFKESLRKHCSISFSFSLSISTFSSSKKNCDNVKPNALQMHCNVSILGKEFLHNIDDNVDCVIPASMARLFTLQFRSFLKPLIRFIISIIFTKLSLQRFCVILLTLKR